MLVSVTLGHTATTRTRSSRHAWQCGSPRPLNINMESCYSEASSWTRLLILDEDYLKLCSDPLIDYESAKAQEVRSIVANWRNSIHAW